MDSLLSLGSTSDVEEQSVPSLLAEFSDDIGDPLMVFAPTDDQLGDLRTFLADKLKQLRLDFIADTLEAMTREYADKPEDFTDADWKELVKQARGKQALAGARYDVTRAYLDSLPEPAKTGLRPGSPNRAQRRRTTRGGR